jgi:hypothetical protein
VKSYAKIKQIIGRKEKTMLNVSAMGICPIHKIDLMAIGLDDTNLAPTCIKCKAAAEPKLGRLQTAEDPGEAFFNKGIPAMPKTTMLDESHGDKAAGIKQYVPPVELNRLEDVVGVAVAQLKRLPMPEDIKQFKAVQKAIKTLESLVEKSNG